MLQHLDVAINTSPCINVRLAVASLLKRNIHPEYVSEMQGWNRAFPANTAVCQIWEQGLPSKSSWCKNWHGGIEIRNRDAKVQEDLAWVDKEVTRKS